MTRLRRLVPADPDVAIVVAFLLAHLVERVGTPDYEGSVLANVVGGVLMSVPFLWRRSRPLAFVLAIVAGAFINHQIATPTEGMFTAIVTLIVVGFSLTRHHEGRDRWIPLGTGLALAAAIQATSDSGAVAFVCLVVLAGAAGGAVLRNRALLTRELAERTHELEALRELRERDAVLDERRRIARELHDVIAHTVSVMVVQAGGARRQLERDPQRATAAMDQVDATGREALTELDRLFGLMHEPTAPSGLGDLPALVERTRAAGLPTTLDVFGTPGRLAADADLAAFRFVQEALTNTLKHGGPGATVAVATRWQDGAVEITVSDTGHGLDGARGEGSRRGLAGMRERLAAFGGDVEAGPRAAGGFEVRARLPVRSREEVPA